VSGRRGDHRSPVPTRLCVHGPAGRHHVLLVDDDAAFLETFGALLTHAGYAVIAELTYAAALNHLGVDSPDVLITDLQLGEDDGWDLIRTARQFQPRLPVIVVTAWPYATDGGEDGGVAHIPIFVKPFDPRDVLGYLNAVRDRVLDARG
jgi:two-component system KDP operon response regulator KdpE